MIVRVLPEAQDEALAAAEWYEAETAELGDRFTESLARAFEDIREHPDRFSKVIEIRSRIDFRRYVLDRFPYSVIYRILSDEIVIVAVAHAKRRTGYWRRRRM